jgi:transcription elongation factor Elf1
MATASKSKKSLQVSCPFCHDEDAVISMDLNQIGTIRCSSCDGEFSAQEARDLVAAELARWEKVARLVAVAAELAAE